MAARGWLYDATKKPFGQPDDGLNSRGRHHCVTEPLLSNWRCHPDRGCDRLARI